MRTLTIVTCLAALLAASATAAHSYCADNEPGCVETREPEPNYLSPFAAALRAMGRQAGAAPAPTFIHPSGMQPLPTERRRSCITTGSTPAFCPTTCQ